MGLINMIDADGSHDPKDISRLFEPVLNGYDVSKVSESISGGDSADITPFRTLGNKWVW